MDDQPQAPETEEERQLRILCERGRCFELGEGVEKDACAALRCYREAAEAGYAEAQWRLGTCYHEGIGLDEDEPEGCLWFTRAAEQGHAEAQFDLGLCYDVGAGVPEDATLAFHWYKAAAERGHADAQHHLAECYEYGLGTEENADAAWFWYNKAAEQGHEEAMEAVEAHRPVEPEVEPELPADGRTNLQRLREAHQFGNAIALRGAPMAAFVAALCEGIQQGSLKSAFDACVGGLFLGYLVVYTLGTLAGYMRKTHFSG